MKIGFLSLTKGQIFRFCSLIPSKNSTIPTVWINGRDCTKRKPPIADSMTEGDITPFYED